MWTGADTQLAQGKIHNRWQLAPIAVIRDKIETYGAGTDAFRASIRRECSNFILVFVSNFHAQSSFLRIAVTRSLV